MITNRSFFFRNYFLQVRRGSGNCTKITWERQRRENQRTEGYERDEKR